MKYSKGLIIVMIMLAVFISSCDEGNDPDLPLARVNVQMKAVTSNGELVPSGMASDGTYNFTEIKLGVTELEFELLESDWDDDDSDDRDNDDSDDDSDDYDDDSDDDSDDYDDYDDDEIEFEGIFEVDLISGTSNPDFGMAEVVPGKYEEIEMEVAPVLSDDNSVVVRFTFEDLSGNIHDVEFTSRSNFEIEIEDEDNGIDLNQGGLNDLLILFDMDELFRGVNFSDAAKDEDGVIRINESSNTALAKQIRDNFKDSFECDD